MNLQIFLVISSKIYHTIVEIRDLLYRNGIFREYKLDARVISVGNITWGGTGKTNLVLFLAEKLTSGNHKVAILIRGYKRKEKGTMIVQPGAKDIPWQEVGDEAKLLASRLDSVPIIVGKDRVKSGRKAIDRYSADFLILDDGFQHRRLERDIDIVMLDSQDPFGNEKLIPAGKLREPLENIKRANVLVLNRAQSGHNKMELIHRLRKHNPIAPIVETEYAVEKIYELKDKNKTILPEEMKDKKILGFCGIGNPWGFKRTLEDLGAKILEFIVFPDHYAYREKDMRKIEKGAQDKGVEFILTTEKDNMRLFPTSKISSPIYIVRIQTKIISGEKELWDRIYG